MSSGIGLESIHFRHEYLKKSLQGSTVKSTLASTSAASDEQAKVVHTRLLLSLVGVPWLSRGGRLPATERTATTKLKRHRTNSILDMIIMGAHPPRVLRFMFMMPYGGGYGVGCALISWGTVI